MRRLLVASVLLVVAPACFGDDADSTHTAGSSPTVTTELTIVYNRDVIRNDKVVVIHSSPLTLTCDPASGDVTNPAAACRALKTHPERFVGHASAGCIGPPIRWSSHHRGRTRWTAGVAHLRHVRVPPSASLD